MPVITQQVDLRLEGDGHIENITKTVQHTLDRSCLRAGIVTIFVQHTTASVMIIEDEPGIRADTKLFWDRLIPPDPGWQHNTRNPGETNGHSHLRGQLQGPSLTVPFTDRMLALGTWQQIVVIDFDTQPRTRRIVLQLIGE